MTSLELRHPERPEGAPPREPSWPLWTAFAALVAGWIGGSVLGAIVYGVASGAGHDAGDAPVGYDLIANLLFDGCLVAAAVFFARMGQGKVTARSFGLRLTKLWPAIGWMFAAFVTYLVVSLIWLNALGLQDERDDVTKQLTNDPTTATVAGLAIFAVVIAPIVEELFFRGFVFPAMRTKLPVGWAAVVTGTMFGIVHVFGSPIAFVLPLAVLGTVLCLLYWKTGSILPCIALHAINNCVALSSALDWGWQIPLLIVGSLSCIAAILLPFLGQGRRVAAPA
jgi:membrane protease YdiL (CAAX protease family)